jgi:hypothetical protein
MQILGACAAVLSCLPGAAQAHALRVSSYEMSEAGGIVMLESDVPVGEPWLRIDAKQVKVWFPNVADVARFDHERDVSEPIRALLLRPGAQDSAVVRIDIGNGHKLTRDNIEITRNGLTAKIRVQFAVAPSALGATPATVAKPAPVVNAAPLAAAKPLVLQGAAKPETALAAKKSTSPASASTLGNTKLGLAAGSQANLGLLIAISALLLVAYGWIKRFAKPRTPRTPDIQVLSARRLGNRSELLVIRALGADHLLVTSQGRIERVASVPSPVEPLLLAPSFPPAATPASAAAEADSQADGLGIITKLSSRYRVRKLLDAVDKETSESESALAAPPPPAAAARPSRRPQAFGPELMSAMNQHRMTGLSSVPQSIAPIANKQSDSVAGIARLRAGTRAN